jgi:hypothetical protein
MLQPRCCQRKHTESGALTTARKHRTAHEVQYSGGWLAATGAWTPLALQISRAVQPKDGASLDVLSQLLNTGAHTNLPFEEFQRYAAGGQPRRRPFSWLLAPASRVPADMRVAPAPAAT